MTHKIHWGIIGLGKIANKFASDISLSNNAVLYGVASRDKDKAREFHKQYNSVIYFDSYEQLAKDEKIEVVYVATPHTFHYEITMMCLKNGKSVLCEKPMGMNKEEVKAMISEAKARNLFLMEGIWTRFIPVTEKLLEIIRQDVIGEIINVRADFGFKAEVNFKRRVYNKQLGGGSLLDIGIYTIYLSLITLGIPTKIDAIARLTETEVDSYCAILFSYENKANAVLESSIESDTPIEAYIYGKKGHIKLHRRFHHSEKISIFQNGVLKEEFEIKFKGNGYLHEIEEVNHCLIKKRQESTKLPLSLSLDLISILDKVRTKIGLDYNK